MPDPGAHISGRIVSRHTRRNIQGYKRQRSPRRTRMTLMRCESLTEPLTQKLDEIRQDPSLFRRCRKNPSRVSRSPDGHLQPGCERVLGTGLQGSRAAPHMRRALAARRLLRRHPRVSLVRYRYIVSALFASQEDAAMA